MYDFIVEISHTIFKNGLTLSALGTALYVLLKQRKVKKRIAKHLPWLLQDDSETKHYIANQARIEAKLDVLSAHMGVKPCGASENGIPGPTSLKQPSRSSQAVKSMAGQLRRKMKMKNKLKSRKFILAVVSAVLIVLNDGLDLGIDSETVLAFAGIVAVWITGESVVDAKRASKTGEESNPGEAYH